MSERWEPGQSTVSGARATEKAAVPQEQEFGGKTYLEAPGLERLGQQLIERHQVLSWLREGQADQDTRYAILYLWRAKAGKSGGKVVRGKATKISGHLAHLLEQTWIVEIAADTARAMNALQLEACLLHQLMHLHEEEVENLKKETVKVARVRGHEFEGFQAEISLYGSWTTDLIGAEKVFGRQLKLDMTGRSTETSDPEDEDDADELAEIERDEALSKARASELVAARPPDVPADARYDAEAGGWVNGNGDLYAASVLEDARQLAGAVS